MLCLQVDENTRKSLFKLRSTWDEVFPLKKLYALDVRVNALDPAWPIKPLPPPTTAIHVNPRFLKQVRQHSPGALLARVEQKVVVMAMAALDLNMDQTAVYKYF